MSDAHRAVDGHRVRRSVETPDLRLRLYPAPTAPGQAREAVAVFADLLPAETLADLRLIVTELVTNSVNYGPGDPITVSISRQPHGGIAGEVLDGGAGGVEIRRDFDPAEGGLGLQIVDALAGSWGVRPGSSNVWFELEPV